MHNRRASGDIWKENRCSSQRCPETHGNRHASVLPRVFFYWENFRDKTVVVIGPVEGVDQSVVFLLGPGMAVWMVCV